MALKTSLPQAGCHPARLICRGAGPEARFGLLRSVRVDWAQWGRHGFDGRSEVPGACRGAVGLVNKRQL
jgi:hypothetical protein